MPSLPTGTVAFLFTDIEGSTTLLQRIGDLRYSEVLHEHQSLLRAALHKGGGREVFAEGDAFVVAFSRSSAAVATAVAAQRALTAHSWPEGASLRVRMGMHTGEPMSDASGYVGIDLHRAARICSVAHGGQILLSGTVAALVAHDLPTAVTLRDLGSHRLKDLREPEHLFQIVHPDLPVDFPPLKSLVARPHNLPRQLTSFVGRENEMEMVKRLLSITSLLTLTGAGGSGKTRLALQVAAELLEHYPDGVWLVELAPLSDPGLLPHVVAEAVGIQEQRDRPLLATLIAALRPLHTLLILDNCEHLVAACAQLVDALLRGCPNLRILATSRETLGTTGETAWPVPPLVLPGTQPLPPVEDVARFEAVRLFVERAAAAQPEFRLYAHNAPAVVRICRRLDGMPLALELAAVRVRALTVEQIAARLDDRFGLLTGGSRVLPRHQTLRATMDWSYGLLSDRERALLRRLSVFSGGCSLTAAEDVCSGAGVDAADVLNLLAQLVDKSLVLVEEEQQAETRYRILETVRQYGREKLLESGEANDVLSRHLGWCLRLAEQGDRALRGPEQEPWLKRLETEHDNLRAALTWSNAWPGGIEVGARLAAALQWFWFVRGYWTEGRMRLEAALGRRGEISSAALLWVLQGAAYLAWRQGDDQRAATLSMEGLALAHELADAERAPWFLWSLGMARVLQTTASEAAMRFKELLTLARERGDKWFTSVGLGLIGRLALDDGDYAKAAPLLEEALILAREAGDTWQIAYAVRNLGYLSLHLREHERAARFYREALVLSRSIGNPWVTEECLRGLAAAASAQGHYEEAVRLFAAAEGLHEALHSLRLAAGQAHIDQHLASARVKLGDSAFTAAWTEGHAMTLEFAVDYALTRGFAGAAINSIADST